MTRKKVLKMKTGIYMFLLLTENTFTKNGTKGEEEEGLIIRNIFALGRFEKKVLLLLNP